MSRRPELKRQARELRRQGYSVTRISRELDLPHSTVSTWLSPAITERNRQRAREAKRREAPSLMPYDRFLEESA